MSRSFFYSIPQNLRELMVGVVEKPRPFSVSVSAFITATLLPWLSQCVPPILVKALAVVVKESGGILVHCVAPGVICCSMETSYQTLAQTWFSSALRRCLCGALFQAFSAVLGGQQIFLMARGSFSEDPPRII